MLLILVKNLDNLPLQIKTCWWKWLKPTHSLLKVFNWQKAIFTCFCSTYHLKWATTSTQIKIKLSVWSYKWNPVNSGNVFLISDWVQRDNKLSFCKLYSNKWTKTHYYLSNSVQFSWVKFWEETILINISLKLIMLKLSTKTLWITLSKKETLTKSHLKIMLNWSRLLMISKSEMTNMFMLCLIIIIMMSIFSRENCTLLPVILELNSPRERSTNSLILTSSPTLIQASPNHSTFSFTTKSNSKIQVLTLKQSLTNIMSSRTMKKFLFSHHISNTWKRFTQKKPRTSNQIMLKMLISVEVSNQSITKILTCWEKLSKKLLNKNGLKTTSHQIIITLSGNLFYLFKKYRYHFPSSIQISRWK